MADGELGSFMRRYIQRVVHEHDLSAADELVSPARRDGEGEFTPLSSALASRL
jgi:hypothetical protein